MQIPIECLQVRGHVVETLAQLDHLGIAGDVDPLTEGVLVLAQLAQLFGKRAQRVDRGLCNTASATPTVISMATTASIRMKRWVSSSLALNARMSLDTDRFM